MEPTLQNFAFEGSARAIAPVLMGLVLIVLFVLGLVLAGNAEDDYMYFAGFAFAGFGLFVGWRYVDRLMP